MLIQCSSCGAQAKLPESKEGAKVRCPSCGHVYVARPKGSGRPGKKDDPTKYVIIGGAILVAIALGVMATRGGDEQTYAAPEKKPKKEVAKWVDPMTWDGPLVSLVVSLHKTVAQGADTKLISKIHGEGAYEWAAKKATAAAAEKAAALADVETAPQDTGAQDTGAQDTGAEDPTPEADVVEVLWLDMDDITRIEYENARVVAAMTPGPEGFVADWKPYDGNVVSMENGIAIIHLQVQSRDPASGLPDRWTRWTLQNIDGESGADDRWRWIDVDRYYTPAELAKMRSRGKKKAERKTLSDGSIVYESEIRAIPFDADVPDDVRQRLLTLTENLVRDLDQPPRFRTKITRELVDTGKPAIAALLTKISEIVAEMPDETQADEDARVRLNFLHNVLRDITGHETTYSVAEEMGGTRERMVSGIRQWFGWYDRKYKRFEGLEETGDPLADDPTFAPQTPEELRKYNKALREELEAKRRGDG